MFIFIKGSGAKYVPAVSDTGGVSVVDRGGGVLPVSEPEPGPPVRWYGPYLPNCCSLMFMPQ
jgi:hypothetical protein